MTFRTFFGLSIAAASCALGACSPLLGAPQDKRLPTVWGAGVADRTCGECHATSGSGRSDLADAPTFRDLRPRYSREAMSAILEKRMVELHPRMPLLQLDVDELNAFLDYWQNIEPAKPGAKAGGPAR